MPSSHKCDHSVNKLLASTLFRANNSAIKQRFEHYSKAFIGDDDWISTDIWRDPECTAGLASNGEGIEMEQML